MFKVCKMGSEANPPKKKSGKRPDELERKQMFVDYEVEKLPRKEEK
jgi:hypothetical protein